MPASGSPTNSPISSPLVTRHPSLPRDARGGFALLITITLLAFLVVLLVGLAAYTRIETAVASNTQRQTQARQNALLGLDVALGQLQKYAGQDQRVTATAESFGGVTGTKHFTGVWDTTQPAGTTPMTWLVSGNELQPGGQPAPLAIAPDASFTTANSAELVGKNSSGTALDVRARLLPVTTVGLPGSTTATAATIGRYAWWVGDQGVKAPVALADPTTTAANFAYDPYTSAELRSRIRQQVSLGAGAADATGAAVFEPRNTTGTAASPSNATMAANVATTNQLAFFKTATATVGLATLQQNFHNWSANNFNVLANTKLGGLRQDLSLKPDLLGSAFVKWADYTDTTYMEDTTAPATPTPSPAYSTTVPLRRRYFMQPAVSDGGAIHSVAPVLSYALVSFNIRTQGSSTAVKPIEARARWMFTLWNPFTAALVPENLRIEITGLPTVRVDDETNGTNPASISLQSVFGSPLNISLPWDSTTSTAADRQSWLPGRVYSWTALQDTNNTGSAPAGGYLSKFYSHNLNADAGQGVQQPASPVLVNGNDTCHIDGNAATLQLKLYAVRSGGDVLLGTFTSPRFNSFSGASPQALSAGTYQFSYVFRLAESLDGAAWLTTPGIDPHSGTLGSAAFVAVPNGPSPELYPNYTTINDPDRLLDRAPNELTYDSDTPVFELPRMPLLSLGALQHLGIAGQRPFAVANSWGMGAQLNGLNVNELFDGYYLSGLVPSVTPVVIGGVPLLPNPTLKVLPRNSATWVNVALADLQGAPNAQSSKFLLQGGAFNLNSVSMAAWAAVLRSVRFAAPQAFGYLNASFGSGTGSDTSKLTVQSNDAQFFRFSQSAQETYEADPGYAASTVDPATGPANPTSLANTHLYRQGMKTLTTTQVTALATRISDAIKTHQASSGPFRSLEEFLNPVSAGSPSLIEQAIIDADAAGAQINVDATGSPIEFSSQFLTQADIMTALAPVLFPRSDTFVIRSYGEALNPTTSTASVPVIEGRAWCEAVVQRVPDYFDPTAATGDAAEVAPAALVNPINTTLGRRFKIVSFRWLTRSDI